MEVILCMCGDLPAHQHVYKLEITGKKAVYIEDPYDVLIWVDWKAVARETA